MTDTADKRASAMLLGLPFRGMLPFPDSDIDAGDRAEVAYLYRGIIDEGGGSPPVDDPAYEWLINARRRGSR